MNAKTSPHLKWLLNERAMLAGELARLNERIEELVGLRDQTVQKLGALDRTMNLADTRVRPDAGGTVRAHTRFGARGALTDFIVLQLQQVEPEFLDTLDIVDRCAAHFAVSLISKRDRDKFRANTVKRALRRLRNAGRVENLRQAGYNAPALWRMKQTASTLDSLSRDSAA